MNGFPKEGKGQQLSPLVPSLWEPVLEVFSFGPGLCYSEAVSEGDP